MTTGHSGSAADPFNLERFVEAQEDSFADAVQELAAGEKRSHWMWFIFPQIDGLGASPMSKRYAIRNLAEARKYLEHPVLGKRIIECTRIVNGLRGRTALEIFGTPDNLKFCSSMTLFEVAAGPDSVFSTALENYCAGQRDAATISLLNASENAAKR